MKNLKIIVTMMIFVVLAGIGGYFTAKYYGGHLEVQKCKIVFEKRKTAWIELKQVVANEIGQFKGDAGIVIKDLNVNQEISFNKEKLFPSASLTKVPIMAACFLAADQGRIKLDRNIALKPADKLTGSGSLKEMKPGATFSVEELIGLMIYDSDNTAANMLTNLVGIDYLKSLFKIFGLKNTTLSRKIADFSSRDKGIENYTTAEDMAFLLEKIYRKNLISKDASEKCMRIMKLSRTNDRIPKYLPTEITIAHKTGLERDVCHDAGIVFTSKGDFIIVVLTKHANSTGALSKEFIAKVSLYAYNYFKQF